MLRGKKRVTFPRNTGGVASFIKERKYGPTLDQNIRPTIQEGTAVTRRFTSLAMALLSATGAAAASELAPERGHSVHIGSFDGAVYYTIEPDGYRVVATLAAGAEAQPIRLISTLKPGQRVVISVPQELGAPSVDFTIIRDGETLVISDDFATSWIDAAKVSAVKTVDP